MTKALHNRPEQPYRWIHTEIGLTAILRYEMPAYSSGAKGMVSVLDYFEVVCLRDEAMSNVQ